MSPEHLAEGLCRYAPITLEVDRESSYLPCSHMNTNSVHNGITIYFDLENIRKKRKHQYVMWIKCSEIKKKL